MVRNRLLCLPQTQWGMVMGDRPSPVDTCEVCGETWATYFLYQLNDEDYVDRCYYCLKAAEDALQETPPTPQTEDGE